MNLMDKKLDLQTIKKYAPARALERGYDYYQSGLVSSVKEYKGVISAKVNDMLCKKLGFHAAQAVSGEFDETAYGTYFTGRQKPTLQFLETPVWESIVVWRMRNGKKWIMLHPGCAGRIPISHRILCTSWKRWRSCPVMSRNW